MIMTGPVPLASAAIVDLGVAGVGWVVLSTGLVGASILDRLRDDGDGDGADGGERDDPLMADDGGALGDLDGGGDLGGLEGDDGDGEWGDDPFGEDDGDEAAAELENRVEELESEVARLSSTVGTVRSENEEISETVDEIQEDVRSLLDIYEMVTRGINPFVDEGAGMGEGGFEDDSFGLFDDDEEESEDVDDDLAAADAEGFFDEDLAADDAFDGFEDNGDAFGDPDDGTPDDDAVSDDTTGEDDMATDDSSDGKTFSELKNEYESGDAEWAEDDFGLDEASDDADTASDASEAAAETEPSTEAASTPDAAPTETGFGADGPAEADVDGEGPGFGDDSTEPEPDPTADRTAAGGDLSDPGLDADRDASGTPDAGLGGDVAAELSGNGVDAEADRLTDVRGSTSAGADDASDGNATDAASATNGAGGTGGFQFAGAESAVEKPYLAALPADYVGDLVVLEWLESLVEAADATDAVRAVNYYERVGWVSPTAAASLREYCTGFGPVDLNRVDEPGCATLTMDHHRESLKYIVQLSGGTAESMLLDRWDAVAGTNGI